jgi:hypothetical protein
MTDTVHTPAMRPEDDDATRCGAWIEPSPQNSPTRKVYCVMSARSLPYARLAIHTLLQRSLDPIRLRLITDDAEDKTAITDAMRAAGPTPHEWSVHDQAEAEDLASNSFARLPNLLAFRHGHPCWRKVTDPLLYASPDEEVVILDPDLYFPNYFRFEPTPADGLLLMWQPPSCLLPDATVMEAYHAGVRLAHHVDIGVAHARNNLDLAWLDWLIGRLGGKTLPRVMHVEAIVWAALAMKVGGGYLHPEHWYCWRNTQWKRILLKLGAKGKRILRGERFDRMKCFHGGGAAKWWVPDVAASGAMPEPQHIEDHGGTLTFQELTPSRYEATQSLKRIARKLGYYALVRI